MTPRLLFAGLSCLDHIWQVETFPPTNSRTHASAYRSQGGGPAATAAVTAARLGAKAELWAIHGDDANGKTLTAELEHYGVDTTQIRTPPGSVSFVSGVVVDPQGERYIFPYRGSGLTDSAEGWNYRRLEGIACVLTDARHPLMNEAVLKEAKRLGIPTVGDWSNLREWHLTRYIDHLIVSEECATEILGRNEPEEALAKIRQFDEQVVGITLGEQGFLFEHHGRMRHVPAFTVDVIDTTGAGDVFHGAYAYAVAMGWHAGRCGMFASVSAALSCTGLGRAAIPHADEVLKMLEKKTAKEMDEMEWI